ncbi:hypothetical protein KGM_210552A, partial [Danaus plexippus plexippus]
MVYHPTPPRVSAHAMPHVTSKEIVRLADVWKTCNKIRAAVFRVGLNLWDWYRPLDPEGNSLISESKFVSVLAGPLRSVVGLSEAEIAQLADYFRAQDGRVLYHQLCQIIHGEEILYETNKNVMELTSLSDHVAKNDGRITFAHFARILDYIGVIVSPEDFNLLVRRFIKDSYTLDYVEFLKAVEAVKKEGIQGLGPAYNNPKAVIDTTLPKLSRPEIEAGISPTALGHTDVFHPALEPRRPPRHLLDIMMRVQEFVLQRRIRVSEFLRDYDPLNCGRISPQQFLRAMDAMGLQAVLSEREARCVCAHYTSPNDPVAVCWRTFEDDCDQVFTIKELEKHPEVVVGGAAAEVSELPALGSADDRGADRPGGGVGERELDAAQAALLRVRAACQERSIDLRPLFGDHDEHNNGHVSRSQVRRVLARAGVLPAAAQLRALETRYLDDCGFKYVALLDELEEKPVESATISRPVAAGHKAKTSVVDPRETDIVQILAKIKGKACPPPPEPECHKLDQWQLRRLCCLLATIAQRDLPLRPYFQDYELVAKNDGRITFAHFARILDYIGVIVSPEDFNLLVRRFIKDSYTLDYVEFLKAVEAVKKEGIQGLGPAYNNPKAVIDTTLPKLSRPEIEAGISPTALGHTDVFHPALEPRRPPRHLLDIMMRVQEFVLQRRIRVSEFLRDYDPLNCGRISPQQFLRAMDAMGLQAVLSEREARCVCAHYTSPNDPVAVCWRTFEDDCDQVFTIKELEKHPEVVVGGAAAEVSELPALGSADDRGADRPGGGVGERELDAAQAALLR